MEQATIVLGALTDARSPIPASSVIGGLVGTLSVARLVTSSVDETFALIPHHTVFTSSLYCPVPFLWNVATAHFFEVNLLKALLITPCLVSLTRLLERLWTAHAILVHVLFTVALSGCSFFAAELLHVYRTQHEKEWFWSTRGCAGLLVAVALGMRHAYPLEVIPMVPRSVGMQFQHLPFALTSFYCIVGLIAPGLSEDWLFAPLAFFFGWVHLRYMMWFPTAQAHGDHSLEFTFASLFPRPLRPPVSVLGSIVHGLVAVVAPSFVHLRQAGETGGSISYDPSKDVVSEDGVSWVGRSMSLAPPPAAGGPVVAGGPGSQEYNARRAKALALLDRNISSLLTPSASRPTSDGVGFGHDVELATAVPGQRSPLPFTHEAPPALAPALAAVPAGAVALPALSMAPGEADEHDI